MKLTPLEIEGAWLAESDLWADTRGRLNEWFKRKEIFEITGIDFEVQQANISSSKKGVIRGIHFSCAPDGQAKWVSCISGSILDVVVDTRPMSPTFRKYVSIELKGGDGRALLIKHGLGHGFISLADQSDVAYLLSSEFNPRYEIGFNPLDPTLEINWQTEQLGGINVTLSEKDSTAPTLKDLLASEKEK
jgi:dTDP-4-dehydrorhamnose 3,5-epimerase